MTVRPMPERALQAQKFGQVRAEEQAIVQAIKKHREMKTKTALVARATSLVESHSGLAIFLAVLCLAFAVNYAFFGPGSDGGSGLGGTGRFGGESGLGGTGKTPDSGPTFKLGANDHEETRQQDNDNSVEYVARRADEPAVEFDVTTLRLNLDPVPAGNVSALPAIDGVAITVLVNEIVLDELSGASPDVVEMLQNDKDKIFANALVSSDEILHGLMTAEAESSLIASNADIETDSGIRNRISMPVRPERPDRLNIPSRVTSVPRAAIPAPPPVRPMRTLSSLLNR